MTSVSLIPAPKAFDQRKRLIVVQAAAVVAIILLLFTKPFLSEGSSGHEIVELLGVVFVLTCFIGRLWSILYVGGKKNDELISMGPFSMTQNPLYFFSTVGAIGIGLMYGSVAGGRSAGAGQLYSFPGNGAQGSRVSPRKVRFCLSCLRTADAAVLAKPVPVSRSG